MSKSNIIVLGSTGNIGMYFLDYLIKNLNEEKYNIIATGVTDIYPYTFYDGKYKKVDICHLNDFKKLPKKNVKAVVDFAGILPAYSSENSITKYYGVNTIGTINVLEYCRNVKAEKIIYMQTWADLNGYLKDGKPLKPYSSYKPVKSGDHTFYCLSKIAAVDAIKAYNDVFDLHYSIFRLPNVYMYSPEKHYYVNGEKKLISYRYLIDRAEKGSDIELWGSPKSGKDILYVKDLCQMIFKAMFTDKSGIYNAGTGVMTTMEEQITGMIEVFGQPNNKSKIIYCPEKTTCDNFVMDISNIKKDLKYQPNYYYLDYLKDYKKEKESNRFIRR